jgi:hypothetical protein
MFGRPSRKERQARLIAEGERDQPRFTARLSSVHFNDPAHGFEPRA